MWYFKANITYEIISFEDKAPQFEQILYCCDSYHFPKTEQLHDLFYSLDGKEKAKKYLSAIWQTVREEDIPANAGIHLLWKTKWPFSRHIGKAGIRSIKAVGICSYWNHWIRRQLNCKQDDL